MLVFMDSRQKYLAKAREALRDATLQDFLDFLTVRRIAGGSATASFYKAFPGGRDELLDELANEAMPTGAGSSIPVTAETAARLMRLVSDLKDQKGEAIDELQEIALANFDGYFHSESTEVDDIVINLVVAAARRDPKARQRLSEYYGSITAEYVNVYSELLHAIDREPIESIGSLEDFATVITALFDGLAIRARMGADAKEILAAALLPVFAALTTKVGSPAPSPQDLLYR
jgi:AcrR family transcriptional regulator